MRVSLSLTLSVARSAADKKPRAASTVSSPFFLAGQAHFAHLSVTGQPLVKRRARFRKGADIRLGVERLLRREMETDGLVKFLAPAALALKKATNSSVTSTEKGEEEASPAWNAALSIMDLYLGGRPAGRNGERPGGLVTRRVGAETVSGPRRAVLPP